jgi:hypothetical protein
MKAPISILAVAALAAAGAGCGEKCATKAPDVQAMATGCTAVAGQPITYPVRVCPACNLTSVTCTDVQISGNQIFLNPTAEECADPSSCSTSCALQPASCTFTVPTSGTYTVTVYDPATGDPLSQTLTVVDAGSPSCFLAAGG